MPIAYATDDNDNVSYFFSPLSMPGIDIIRLWLPVLLEAGCG